MRIRILGPLQVETESGLVVDLGPPKQRALLALLAITPNSVLTTDRIIDALWGNHPPTNGARNISVYVSRLRDVLEPDRPKRAPGHMIVTEQSGYSLRIDPEDIDAVRFESLIGEARARMQDHPGPAGVLVERALELWRDHPLSDVSYEEFAQGEIRHLEELHLQALELRYEASIRTSEVEAAIPELERLIALHPLRERFVALQMEALAGAGRRSEALRAFRSLTLRLADETGLEPSSELHRLEEHILLQTEGESGREDLMDAGGRISDRLPARLTSLIGRAEKLAEVAVLLGHTRLLTLTGPGGVGKTSLAIEAARAAAGCFPGGVWLVDLSALQEPSRLAVTVADALDVADAPGVALERSIAAALGGGENLLLLDNCEHLVDPVAFFCAELLGFNPELTILCTSRRSLAMEGETVYEVPPLPLPSPAAGVDELRDSPSAQLLLERGRAATPGFAITARNAADVAGLCTRLDGIPLAIELAASNLRFMTITEITDSLSDRLSLGRRQRALPRHQTLRATMQWSYDLLSEREQGLFDRLSVFAGRFSRAAALAVGARHDGEAPMVELAALVDASMIAADVSGPITTYRMLPTVRDFGVFNLRERGDLEAARRAHARYLNSLATTVDLPTARTGGTKPIAANVSFADFAAATNWALQSGQTDLAIALLVTLGYHWINGGRLDEASHWLGRVHELGGIKDSFNAWKLRLIAAQLDWFAGRNEQAEEEFRSLSAQAAEMDEPHASADARQLAGYVRWRSGDLQGARDDMAAASDAGVERPGRSMPAREGLAVLELYLGNTSAAEAHAQVLDAFADRTGDPVARCNALNARAWLACYTGDLEESVRSFEQCRDIGAEQGDWHHEVNARLGLAWVLPAIALHDEALAAAEEARNLSEHAANAGKLAEALILMGWAHLDLGDVKEAARSVSDGLRIFRERVRRVDHLSRGLRFAGWIALTVGDALPAFRFMSAAEAEHVRIHFVDPPADAARSARSLGEAAAMLSEAERDAIKMEGSPFSTVVSEAIDYLHQLSA